MSVGAPVVMNTGRVVASGWAKKLASESGVDLRTVAGTGPGGRIVGQNVQQAAGGSAPAGHRSPPGSATPQAKKLASEAGLDIASVRGTGNFGRVTADDVLIALGKKPAAEEAAPAAAAPAAGGAKKAAAPSGPTPKGLVPMDGMMKAVAKNMEKTLDVPIFRVSRTIVTDKFDELYKKVRSLSP
jgi:pyruvate dehydrogenase E2 component (dihydrolipoamide acetyltransferase)